jgi:hypothetical protein
MTGKRRQRFETFHGNKKEADRRLTELLSLHDQQKLGVTAKTTVVEYLDSWLRNHGADLAPKTRATYGFPFRAYVAPHTSGVQLEKLKPSVIIGLIRELREAPRVEGRGGHLSPAAVSAFYRVLHVALATAVKWRVLATSPMDGVDTPSVPRNEMRTFDVAQAQAFPAAAVEEGT